MRFGKREPQGLAAVRRGAYRPRAESLEGRVLLTVDLVFNGPPSNPLIATNGQGVDLGGGASDGGAGWSVTDVGDMNQDGFDDYVVGGPTVQDTTPAGQVSLSTGSGLAYLIFGSKAVNSGTINTWLSLTNADQRVGDLAQLGNPPTGQNNPITGNPTFPFDGLTFKVTQNPNAQLGASVAGLGLINNTPAFIIGAPGARDINNANAGTGRAYVIYGGQSLNLLSGTHTEIDLDNTSTNQGVTFVTLTGVAPNGQIGRAVAGPGNTFAAGPTATTNTVAIGAPGATINGNGNAGAVFLLPGTSIPTTTATVNLNTVGQSGGRAGVIFGGASSGAMAGFSIAGAGDVDGSLVGNIRVPDLLIGAPAVNTGQTP